MSNLAVVNAGAVNSGAKYVAIFASATLLATATLDPTANRVTPGAVAAQAAATVVAAPIVIQAASTAPLGLGEVVSPTANVRWAGTATIEGTATLLANPLQYVYADIQFTGQALVSANAGAAQGAASPQGIAELTATATRIASAGTASAEATGTIAPPAATGLRLPTVALQAAATVVADAGINGRYNGAAQITGVAEVGPLLLGVVIQRQEADFQCTATLFGAATQIQAAAVALDTGATILADANRVARSAAAPLATATLDSAGTRVVLAQAAPLGAATIPGVPTYQRHAGATAPLAVALLTATGTALRDAGTAQFEGIAEIAALAPNVRTGGAATLTASAEIAAHADSNMQAVDPPDRTMRRPFTDRDMTRPFVDREMKATVV
jgi:hypothetical protein